MTMSDVSKPYSDADARAATDGQIDSDTVDNQHAKDLGTTLTDESGSITPGGQFNQTTTISFSNSYETAIISTGIVHSYSGKSDESGLQSWVTDASGNITGARINYTDESGAGTLHWNMMGVPA